MPFFGGCVQKICPKSKVDWITYNELFRHYWKKGREVLIELALENNVSSRPYSEPTYILADKLVKISKIDRESLE